MSEPERSPSRRRVLGLGAGAVLGGAAGGLIGGGVLGSSTGRAAGRAETRRDRADTPAPDRMTLARWVATRSRHYPIAHRGSGDVLPEHSMEAYDAALQWGARAMEISVGMTSDGVLLCMHDATYDRTTTIRGRIADQPSTVLRSAGIDQPQLGPAWAAAPLPRIPLFTDVLQRVGGRAVLCVEAKDDDAYGPMMTAIHRVGLQDTIIAKVYYRSPNLGVAKREGRAVFSYLDVDGLDEPTIAAAAAQLDGAHDYLALPARDAAGALLSDDILRAALSHHVPVWVYPVHRRSELDHYVAAGVSGALCSSYGYLSRRTALAKTDSWASKAVAPGELSASPGSPDAAPSWTGEQELTLDRATSGQYLCLGQFGPVTAHRYRIAVEVRFNTIPPDGGPGLVLAFGNADDAPYSLRDGVSSGYHVVVRATGELQLFRHDHGRTEGVLLADARGPRIPAGTWTALTVDVTASTVAAALHGAAPISSADTTARGGYLHVGRAFTGAGASLSLRRMSVTPTS